MRKKVVKNLFMWISFVTLIILCINFIFNYNENEIVSGNVLTVVIDAGHGGSDFGVHGVNSNVSESELNLLVAYKLKNAFENKGVEVVMTREGESVLNEESGMKRDDFNKRKEIINEAQPDFVISIHQNKFPDKKRRGAQVFYNPFDEKGVALANSVQSELNKINLLEVGRSFSALKGDYFILNCSTYPSCIVECGFLSNPDDDILLNTDEYQTRLSESIVKGVFNLVEK